VPTKEDFLNLNKALGGTGVEERNFELLKKYTGIWGGTGNGLWQQLPQSGIFLREAGFWSASTSDTANGFYLSFFPDARIFPLHRSCKSMAHALRCVR
jgi:hypothetical protein